MADKAMATPSWKRKKFTVASNGDDQETKTGEKLAIEDKKAKSKHPRPPIENRKEIGSPRTERAHGTMQSDKASQLREVDRCIQECYEMVWSDDPSQYHRAIKLLQSTMNTQKDCLGKHHSDIGWTSNFIGTAYWRLSLINHEQNSEYCKSALQYVMEARRIFCKAQDPASSQHPPTPMDQPQETLLIDRRIRCILMAQMGWSSKQALKFTATLQQRINYEVQGDWWKAKGDLDRADSHYQKARQLSSALCKHIG